MADTTWYCYSRSHLDAVENLAPAVQCRVCGGRRCDALAKRAEEFIEQNHTDSIKASAAIRLFAVWLDENLSDSTIGSHMNERMLSRDLTDLLACALHYQERGEPDYSNMTAAEIAAMWDPVPRPVQQRYLNDPKFHMQVERAVAGVMMLATKARLSDQPGEEHGD